MTGGPAAVPTQLRYETEVVTIGPMVEEFRATGLMILFGEIAPEELHDIAVLHRPRVTDSAPRPGDLLRIDTSEFLITAVGSVVEENLLRLGHLSVKANGERHAAMPGDLNVEARELPLPQPGSMVRFIAGPASGTGSTTEEQA